MNLKKLAKLANYLDRIGLKKEADIIDGLIKKAEDSYYDKFKSMVSTYAPYTPFGMAATALLGLMPKGHDPESASGFDMANIGIFESPEKFMEAARTAGPQASIYLVESAPVVGDAMDVDLFVRDFLNVFEKLLVGDTEGAKTASIDASFSAAILFAPQILEGIVRFFKSWLRGLGVIDDVVEELPLSEAKNIIEQKAKKQSASKVNRGDTNPMDQNAKVYSFQGYDSAHFVNRREDINNMLKGVRENPDQAHLLVIKSGKYKGSTVHSVHTDGRLTVLDRSDGQYKLISDESASECFKNNQFLRNAFSRSNTAKQTPRSGNAQVFKLRYDSNHVKNNQKEINQFIQDLDNKNMNDYLDIKSGKYSGYRILNVDVNGRLLVISTSGEIFRVSDESASEIAKSIKWLGIMGSPISK